jgi:hypothetical protein
MQFTTEDEPDLTIPDETIARAQLEQIKLRQFEWNDRKTGEKKEGSTLEWWWKITATNAGEEFIGRTVRGECNPKLSNRGDNRFRIWAEALLNREIPVGMTIDTDDLVGLSAEIVIGVQDDRKDPLKKWNRVTDVIPLLDGTAGGAFQGSEPPF